MKTNDLENVTILIVGFNRGLEHNWAKIETNVIEAVRHQGYKPVVLACVSSAKKLLTSKRFAESAWTTDKLPREFEQACDHIIHLKAKTISLKTLPKFVFAMIFGDPWPETRYKSLRNLLHNLKLQAIAENSFSFGSGPIVFLRSDMEPLEKLDLRKYRDLYKHYLITPNWHRWGLSNDRVAIGPPNLMRLYLSRERLVARFLLRGVGKLHAEKFLFWATYNLPRKHLLTEKFARTRAGGNTVQEDFETANISFFGV